jgi:mycothiol synthase
MTHSKKPFIILKEFPEKDDYDAVNALQTICCGHDKTSLKLELDYKMSAGSHTALPMKQINEFMYHNGQEITGYIGIGSFGGSTPEVNGMVHPDHRHKGIFRQLFGLVLDEARKREVKALLLLCDRKSDPGQAFIKTTGASYAHTEYEMVLTGPSDTLTSGQSSKTLTLRKATNEDAHEIARQNAVYFASDDVQAHLIMPEEEEKRGMTIWIAEDGNQIIGKVHVQLHSGLGGIYGLGVMPEFRSRGFGRLILKMAVQQLQEMNADAITLQVEARNANALNLYQSCGFEETSTMDYYLLKIQPLKSGFPERG